MEGWLDDEEKANKFHWIRAEDKRKQELGKQSWWSLISLNKRGDFEQYNKRRRKFRGRTCIFKFKRTWITWLSKFIKLISIMKRISQKWTWWKQMSK